MANPQVTSFIDDASVTLREAEVPLADFDTGMNAGGSCACGVGINIGGGAVVGEDQQFTLLDQDEDARAPQVSQPIGGEAYVLNADYPSSGGTEGKGTVGINAGNPSATGDGQVTVTGEATLAVLATGWTSVVPV